MKNMDILKLAQQAVKEEIQQNNIYKQLLSNEFDFFVKNKL